MFVVKSGVAPSGRAPRRTRITVFVAAWLLVVAYAFHAGGWLLPGSRTLFDSFIYNGALLLATGLVAWRVYAIRDNRGPWLAFAVALLFWTLGFVAYDAFVDSRDPILYPSISDFFWIAFYPAVYVGLVLLLRVRVQRVPISFWFHGLIALFGLSAIVAALLFEPIQANTGSDAATLITTLAYPIGDLIALAFVLTIFAVTNGRPGRGPALVMLAFAIEFPADIAYAYKAASGTYQDGGLLDVGWPVVTLLIAHAAWQPRPERRRAELGTALLVLPIAFAVISVGLLLLGNFIDLSTPAVVLATLTLLAAVTDAAVTAIESGRLRKRADSDSLTGLLNHAAFHSAVQHELVDAATQATPTSVVLFDLDRFKQINDTQGHAAGDRILRGTAAALREASRNQDLAARVGGDEFALLLPRCSAQAAKAIAIRVQAAVSDLGDDIGICFGIAEAPTGSTAPESLVAEADRRLYIHKTNRRASERGLADRD